MNVGSLFSGIGGIDLGLERAGMSVVFQAEQDEYRRRLLGVRFPGVQCWDDVAAVGYQIVRSGVRSVGGRADAGTRGAPAQHDPNVDLICGGFPCQDLSVAGKRRGLAGTRSGLFFEFARIADTLRPRFVLVENVPGLLSSDGGRDFGVVLGTLADIGYGLGWRILDSRFFGVPQRRRRVFIVGVLAGTDSRAASVRAGEILAVGSRCEGHSAKGREAGQDVAGTLGGGAGERGWAQDTERMTFIPQHARSLKASGDSQDDTLDTYVAAPLSHGSNPNSNMAGRRREDDENLVAMVSENQRAEVLETPYARQLTSGGGKPGQGYPMARQGASVRRLTPTECERLQGFPDGWTQLGDTPDSRRYAALGDAVTVNVAEWIGHRIMSGASIVGKPQ